MAFSTDIEKAQSVPPLHISKIAESLGLPEESIEVFGRFKAKIDFTKLEGGGSGRRGKLILVTAMTPTPAGEGKTTVTVGTGDALKRLGKRAVIALREPSLGPVFGMKGGAAGGGYSQVIPMEDINLHFTGDFHAIGAANNLLAAMLDNHIFHGNSLNIDPRQVLWRRCVDMNDRQLRNITDGLGGKGNGVPREDGFDITVASEIMAVLCLSEDISDLKARLSRIIVAYSFDGKPVTAGDLKAQGAMTALLRDALKPNLVQTLEHTPAIIHGGPFANIAHGCNSVIATKTALSLGKYTVTEAGFGADLGAEKFFDIKCRTSGLRPDAVVIVATLKALKYNGGVPKEECGEKNTEALKRGLSNLRKHIENITQLFGLPAVVAINRFSADCEEETALVKEECAKLGVKAVSADVWAKGGEGGLELARELVELCERENSFRFAYDLKLPLREKIGEIARRVYGADGALFTAGAEKQLERIEKSGFSELPVCMAKTQYSLSDDKEKRGRPSGFEITVRQLVVNAGAGFIVALTGDILKMPGLPKQPAAEKIDCDAEGKITGLF